MIGAFETKRNDRNGSNGVSPRKGDKPTTTRLKQWLLTLLAFVVCVAALTREPTRDTPTIADLDNVVSNREIRAMFYFEAVDLQRTQEARDLEMARVPDYYRIDQGKVARQLQLLRLRVNQLREERAIVAPLVVEALRASTPDQSAEEVATKVVSGHAATLKERSEWEGFPEADLLALWLTPDSMSLPERDFLDDDASGDQADAGRSPTVRFTVEPPESLSFNKSDIMGEIALEALEYVLMAGVRPSIPPAQESRRIVIMRERALANLPLTSEVVLGEVSDEAKAIEVLTTRLTETAQRAARDMAVSDRWARMHDAALALAQPLVVDTIEEDKVYTAGARARAAEAAPPVMKEIEAGEIIQDRGRRWTKQSRSDVQTYMDILAREERTYQRLANTLAAHTILVFLVFMALHKRMYFQHHGNPVSSRTAINLALLLLCSTLVIGRIVSYFEPTGYVLPVATAGILYAILVGPQRAALFGALAAALVSAQYQYNWRLLLVAGAMTLAGSFSIYGVRKRSDMTAAALVATLVGLLAVGAAILATDTLFGEIFLRRLILIILNGALCLLAVPGVLPWLEKLFGITTDMQLLEYSDLNNELLRKLAMAAPATYAHSLLLGQIAEAAANEIGANGLLARVCAYYHDIGKRQKPHHFTENQGDQKNIHDSMPPRRSAELIRQHVVEGAKEAMEHKLPQPIIDGILEHHGTCKIGFFYDTAVKEAPDEDINEADFRYPGPRPQRPETAILMICDASESGVRSLEHPDFETVQRFVGNIIRMRSEDSQFDDCDLTFRQLTQIRDVVAKALVNAMHTRIAYPPNQTKPNGKRRPGEKE